MTIEIQKPGNKEDQYLSQVFCIRNMSIRYVRMEFVSKSIRNMRLKLGKN